jgi:AmmeMemoRadiSam system protein A
MSALSAQDRQELLRLARAAAEAALRHLPPPPLGASSAALARPSGAFVTLYLEGELRGCVGFTEPRWPLAETVVRAGGIVVADRRFPMLLVSELPAARVEVSVLSQPYPIAVEDIQVGTHGLVLRLGRESGLLLPQVPLEHGWDRDTFLDQVCRKAGLPAGAFRHPDAQLSAFTSERFSDRD